MRRRIHVEPDDVSQLGGKLRVVGQLEQTRPVRLQTMPAPDALHRTDTDALDLGHGGGGPVRRLARRIGPGRRDDARHHFGFERRDARRACLVTQQASDTIGHKAFLPAPDSRLADTGIAHDLGCATAVCRQQDDPCPPDMLLRSVSVRHDRVQLVTIRGTHFNFDAGAHPADSHFSAITGIPNRTRIVRFYPLSCSPFQAADTEIPCSCWSCSAWPPLGMAGGTIMKTTVDHALMRGLVPPDR